MTYIHKGKLSDGCKKAWALMPNAMITRARKIKGFWIIRVVEIQHGNS